MSHDLTAPPVGSFNLGVIFLLIASVIISEGNAEPHVNGPAYGKP